MKRKKHNTSENLTLKLENEELRHQLERARLKLKGYPRQAFYKQLHRNANQYMRQDFILEQIHLIRKLMPRIGCRKLYALLTERGVKIGRDALFQLLRENNLLVKRRKKHVITTNSKTIHSIAMDCNWMN